jgi:hypothetical protein
LGGNSTQWNTAYGWGNHADAGYSTTSHNHDGRYLRLNPRLSANADTITESGIHIWDVSTATDDPSGAGDGLLTTKFWDSTSWAVQQYHDFHSNSLYLKSKQNNAWQASWEKVWTDTNLTNVSQLSNDAGYTGDQNLSGYLLNTTDDFNGTLNIFGGNNNSKESFLNVKRGNGGGEWLKFQTDATSSNDVSQFVIRRNSDSVDLISIATSNGATSINGDLAAANLSGTNTGDQDLSGYSTTSHNHDGSYVKEGGTSFNGVYPMVVRTSSNTIYSDGDITFTGSDSTLFVGGSVKSPLFYDSNDTAYYLNPASTSVLNELDIKDTQRWYRTGGSAHQRVDARLDGTDQARMHWYGKNDSNSTFNFKHAWYDGVNYINVTADSGKVIIGGEIHATGNVYGNQFGDNQDTNYYVNPANNSVMKAATFDGTVTAASFVGPLTGNASTATWADTVDVNASNNTGANEYPIVWHSGDTVYSSSQFTIHRDNNTITAPIFKGALDGNAGTATNADNANLLDNISSGSFLRSDVNDSFNTIITGNALHLGGSQITGSAAVLQVNGFQRTGNIYLHEGGNTPTTTALPMSNVSGNLQWDGNTVWTSANDGSGSGLDADLLDGQHASAFQPAGSYTPLNEVRSLGSKAFTNGTDPSITTAQVMDEIDGDGGFDSYSSMFKTSWSYAGNYNLTDAGDFTETAGSSWLTWTDNSSDSSRGNFTALAIAPNTGSSAGGVFIYNDQGSNYAPGWREVWTNMTDGAGSGLDADLLDGQQGSYYAPATGGSYLPLAGGTMTGELRLFYDDTDAPAYRGIDFNGNGDYIIKASSAEGVFGRKSFGWHVGSDSAFGVYSSGWEKLFGVEGGTGNAFTKGTMSSTAFYDSDDTNYYLNPNGLSRVSSIMTNNSGASPRYDTAFYVIQGQHWYGDTGSQLMYIGESGNPVRLRGSLRIGSNADADSGMALTVNGSSNATSSFRAPMFYDSNNTAYYIHADNHSYLNTLALGGNSLGFINKDRDAEIRVTDDNFNGTGAEFVFYGDLVAGNAQLTAEVGNFTGQVRSPIFYDSTDTNYKLDPASTSNLNGLTVNGTITGSITGSSGSVGGIDISKIVYGNGPSKVQSQSNANTQTNSGFYENGGGSGTNWPSSTWYSSINVRHSNQGNYHGFQAAMSFYDNNFWFRSYQGSGTFQTWEHALGSGSSTQTKSGVLKSTASFRAPYFYDPDNTGYYLRPASTSNLNVVNANTFKGSYKSSDGTAGITGSKTIIDNNSNTQTITYKNGLVVAVS